ncbi:hypothetical protein, partial [Bradyrhizobium sp. Mp27]|uniref:hypothetical protein n=1 Tax=Bradyrhizobium sp. Mp27 TaxID=3042157 RepID=UPI00248B81CA
GGSSSSSSLLIRSKNPRRCQAENPLKLLSEFAGPALPSQGRTIKRQTLQTRNNYDATGAEVAWTASRLDRRKTCEGDQG